MVKSNDGTIGDSHEGCRALSSVVNVFVGEDRWAELGPQGAMGSCSSVVYWNPRELLDTWSQVREANWPVVSRRCEKMKAVFKSLFAAFGKRGFTDTAYDRLVARATGFLKTSLVNRGPYASPVESDIGTVQQILRQCYPELLTA